MRALQVLRDQEAHHVSFGQGWQAVGLRIVPGRSCHLRVTMRWRQIPTPRVRLIDRLAISAGVIGHARGVQRRALQHVLVEARLPLLHAGQGLVVQGTVANAELVVPQVVRRNAHHELHCLAGVVRALDWRRHQVGLVA